MVVVVANGEVEHHRLHLAIATITAIAASASTDEHSSVGNNYFQPASVSHPAQPGIVQDLL